MKPIYIVGAGGAAKEIFLLIQEICARKKEYEFKGFIDLIQENTTMLVGGKSYAVFSESIFLKEKNENTAIVFGLGSSKGIDKVLSVYSKFEYPNLIHPDVSLHDSVSIGIGNVISKACVLTLDISIGSFNLLNRGVHIGHDCTVGSYNIINPCAVISGGVIIKNNNLIGSNATVLQYLNIGSGNQIGAGAVLTKSINDNLCMVGVPAKLIKSYE